MLVNIRPLHQTISLAWRTCQALRWGWSHSYRAVHRRETFSCGAAMTQSLTSSMRWRDSNTLVDEAQANVKAGVEEEVDANQYVNPAFNFDEADHEELLAAAATVDAVLKGEKGEEVRVDTLSHRSVCQFTNHNRWSLLCFCMVSQRRLDAAPVRSEHHYQQLPCVFVSERCTRCRGCAPR